MVKTCYLIKKKSVAPFISAVILLSYAYSQLSWGNFISSTMWSIVLLIGICLLQYSNLENHYKFKVDFYFVVSLLMIIIICFWNNYDIKNYGWRVELYNILVFIMFWISRNNQKIFKYIIPISMFWGLFYVIWTYICTFVPEVYNSFVYPLMAPMGYISDYKAGFTAFYTTNGYYISVCIISTMAQLFFNGKKKKSIFIFTFLCIELAAMFFSGKRGLLLALLFSMLVTYYVYNINKKSTRIMKIIFIALIAICIYFVAAQFVPQLNTIVERFQEQIQKNDISTGRFQTWATAWSVFKDKPLVGYGWRWFRFTTLTADNYDVHNCFIQLFVETGVLGSIAFYLFIISNLIVIVRLVARIRKNGIGNEQIIKLTSFSLMFQIFFIVMCFIGTALYQVEFLIPYFLACSISLYFTNKMRG